MTSPKSKHNTITIFSNGIGHFRRIYDIPNGDSLKITIPVNSNDLSDALESLTVFGDGVKLDSPPSFAPTNNEFTTLNISEAEGFSSLLKRLSGAEVRVKFRMPPSKEDQLATLIGCESIVTINGDKESTTEYLVTEEDGTICRHDMSNVANVTFTQQTVQSEISKALKRKFTTIKPNSTLIELSVSSKNGEPTQAIVYYKVPVASWKMRFSIRQDNNASVLEGCAIIDNNTEEDWQDFIVSVVTGNPISFRTDYGLITIPNREFVRIVDETSLGNVAMPMAAPSRGIAKAALMACSTSASFGGTMSGNIRNSYYNASENQLESVVNEEVDYEEMAEAPGVESREVGDFCIFTANEPVSINSKRSAIIPMFVTALKNVTNTLVYKNQNHSTRPFRAVKFKNDTAYSLSKGKVVVYQEGVFSGECVMEATKPGDNRTLPYCLENGVRVFRKAETSENTQSSISLAKGFVVEEWYERASTTYSVENRKDEKFKFIIEHQNQLSDSTLTLYRDDVPVNESEVTIDKLTANSWRVYFNLDALEKTNIKVSESVIRSRKFTLNANWLSSNSKIVTWEGAKEFSTCLKLCKELDSIQEDINETESTIKDLNEQIVRLRENLKVVSTDKVSSTRDNWITQLDDCENSLRENQKVKLVDLKKNRRAIEDKLNKELAGLTYSWHPEEI